MQSGYVMVLINDEYFSHIYRRQLMEELKLFVHVVVACYL